MTARQWMASGIVAVALAAALPAAPAAAQRSVPQDRGEITLSFAPIVKRVAPAVVNIYAKKVVAERSASPFANDPLFRRFFGDGFPPGGQSEPRVENSLGSGVIVRPEGIIVTNHHVIKDAQAITVALADRREFDAELLMTDERTDLAVLRIKPGNTSLDSLPLGDSDAVEVGDLVLAIGNPFGVGQTVTSGIVSALARTSVGIADYRFFIQTDAAINPGNSGGALVGMDGRLIGVNTAIYSRTGGSLGIGFAVPSNMVATVVESAVSGKPLARAWLGFSGVPVNAEMAAAMGLARPMGVLVESVNPAGPTAAAGLRRGDVVTAVDGVGVDDPEALRYRLATKRIGGEARLTILRDGRERMMGIALVAPPEVPRRQETVLEGRHPLAGAKVANLSPALAEELGVDSDLTGVIVLAIARDAPVARLGIRPGDQILRINGQPVTNVDAVLGAVRTPLARWTYTIRRQGREINVEVG
ncbi:MAG: DegQ family serine endoprotease [Alphaproteobacteria bacterium]